MEVNGGETKDGERGDQRKRKDQGGGEGGGRKEKEGWREGEAKAGRKKGIAGKRQCPGFALATRLVDSG